MDCSDEGRNLSILLGDGAGALVVRAASPSEQGRGLIDVELGADGSYFDLLRTSAPGCSNESFMSAADIAAGRHQFRMQGPPMFEHAVATMVRIAGELLVKHRLSVTDIDVVVPHQPNVRIIEAVLAGLGISRERCVITCDRLGNIASASLPVTFAIATEQHRIRPDRWTLLLAYGAGATWGAGLYRA
jgi:3-oxoacyl-[acyl-carrier-protein] synthase-3